MTEGRPKQRFFFIVNPQSGSSANVRCLKQLKNTLRQRQNHVNIQLTQSLEHAGQLACQAVAEDYDIVIVSGGDGTVRQVAQALAGARQPILIIPSGTENLLARELGLDNTLESALNTIDYGSVRDLDLGQAGSRRFMAIVGVGYDAEVIKRINKFRNGHISHTDYFWPICRTFWEYRFPRVKVIADGQEVSNQPSLVFVANISRYALGLGVLPEADCGDGLLDLCVYNCKRRRYLLAHAVMTILGISHKSRNVLRRRCKKVQISTDEEHSVPVQVDGDPAPPLPLDIEVIPSAAKVLVPPGPGHFAYRKPARLFLLRKWLIG